MPLPKAKVPKGLLLAGFLFTLLPLPILYLLDTKPNVETPLLNEQGSLTIDNLADHYSPRHIALKFFLWGCVGTGLTCLVVAFRKTLPDPERILWEEEWDKKGR